MRRIIATPFLFLLLAQANGQDTIFTADVHLVIYDVGVKDKSGKIIPGLKKSDFTLLEDGKPQQLAVFEFQKLDSDEPMAPIAAGKPGKIASAAVVEVPGAPRPVPPAKPANPTQ